MALSSRGLNTPELSSVPEFYGVGFKAALGEGSTLEYIHLFCLNHNLRQLK